MNRFRASTPVLSLAVTLCAAGAASAGFSGRDLYVLSLAHTAGQQKTT